MERGAPGVLVPKRGLSGDGYSPSGLLNPRGVFFPEAQPTGQVTQTTCPQGSFTLPSTAAGCQACHWNPAQLGSAADFQLWGQTLAGASGVEEYGELWALAPRALVCQAHYVQNTMLGP